MTSTLLAEQSDSPVTPQRVLEDVFGYQEFRDGQQLVIDAAVEGRDSLVILPTGGGKSLCYQIPALVRSGITLVISPLISLMKDQVDQLKANGVAAECINSTMPREELLSVYNRMHTGHLKLVYVSPERVLMRDFIERLENLPLSMIAVDEAHCISQWGHDFRPEYAALGQLKQQFSHVPFMALTATADDATRRDILERLQLNNPEVYLGSFDRPNIRYNLVEKHKPVSQIVRYLETQKGNCGIIYCGSRKKVEMVTEKLCNNHIRAAGYHAGMDADERAYVQEAFQRDDIQIVVATVAFGMGINKPNVRFVVHFDIPRNIESYYQETGRAGRDGLPAEAMMLYDPADISWLRRMLDEKDDGPQKQVETHKLNAMSAFAEAQTCRRQVLLNYFGEYREKPCGNCDICLDPPKHFDATEEARKALSCVYRVNQSFGMGYVVEVLRGMQNIRVRENGHDKISTYAIGRDHSHDYWVSIFRQLIHKGLLFQNITRNSTLQLTEEARPLLRGDVTLELAVPRLDTAARAAKSDKLTSKNYDKKLFAKLRKLRKSIADEDGLPPYVVFSDATLIDMAEILPTSYGEMLAVSGVGQRKLEKYADPFLDLIQEHITHHG
ncbi:ATP-dependent DNA helicase RecQ [Vibrio alginolyticus]|jgi:ATP-dependent DNA helicase RecQ|uniref:DNA helicase RecQ n=10 Tax=Vibrio TaxID=662 RepID=A0A0L8DB08_VIBAL|nr:MULTISPECIES: ATP-dependent DNA helicase RecQ [Vibrio]MDW2297672.1 ATP-dependent DNA helicase RecQ [Vibrio sp. 1404]NAW55566.1 ATP-dependent DNA helicase RecQ [Vibrio sp. V41_P2S12T139]NAW93645.1 ATP-dependent DNA helicase RecQ [Vibrio sp. V42_P2S4T144]QCO87477.1 ATP-dependent DNA helicase RecQ [Vibrio neocaledonicus]AGV17919.1 ATP-dependent DNA helicase RecQ [Vibrio alginolyticus NBRC 15630 = ATCC 17749]